MQDEVGSPAQASDSWRKLELKLMCLLGELSEIRVKSAADFKEGSAELFDLAAQRTDIVLEALRYRTYLPDNYRDLIINASERL